MNTDSILIEAEEIINGSRDVDYGDPTVNFTTISNICKEAFGMDIKPSEACKVLIAVKLTRERFKHKRDNLIDLCGYAEILNRIMERENK